MKVLVTYLSQTGNTEKIAKAIHEEASKSNEAEIKKLEDTDAGSFGDYDVVFVGTPIHMMGLSNEAKTLLGQIPDGADFKLAGFVTHMSDAYTKENFEKGITSFGEISEKKGITYLGCYDCQGKLTEKLRPMVKQVRKLPDDEWAKVMEETDKHPSPEDEEKAREFARDVLAKS